jgi:two-component system, cell cycle sensor histidine kinase and response regulator CckA
MDGDLHFALSRFVLEHQRDFVIVLGKDGRVVVDINSSARAADLDIAALFDVPVRDVRIEAFLEELELSGLAHTLVASASGAVFRLEGTAVDKFRVVVARQLSKASDAQPALGVVAASFVHDFNNLLTPILLLSGRLARVLGEGSEGAMMASDIHASASIATALARDVLALARPRMPAIERVDVNDLLRGIERLTRRLAGPKVDVLFALADEAPLETCVDRKRLEHAVLSLVVAARDAMPNGGQLGISTALVEHAGSQRIALSLTDSGEQASTRAADGFPIDVRSTPERGTSATVLLEVAPIVPAAQSDEERGTRVVMVAEGDELLRRAVKKVLQAHGWTVVSVASQDDALEAAAVHPLRVAILDASIFRRAPTLFLHQLRALAPKMRLVLSSDHLRGEQVPPQVVLLTKPFGDEELVRAIDDALG